jgi:hypothetical protein
MRNAAFVLMAAGVLAAAPARAEDCAPREERVDASGVTRLRVLAAAGSLRIDGRAGAGAVVVRGTACASRASVLDDIRLRAARSGSEVTVEALIPESSGWLSWGEQRLDLVLEVPAGVTVDVEDGSGSVHIRNVAAASVNDGSGEMVLEGIAGQVRISDGSGGITVRDAGSVLVEEDGSGGIDVSGIRGDVRVRDDGSGSISVRDVAGDFTVDDDGSGGIHYATVQGRVRVPSRD